MTPRPGRIVADVPVDLDYPRVSSLRTAPRYTELCRALSHRLAEAMTA
jgi:NitT/TauT family transport system ATP-binding protein